MHARDPRHSSAARPLVRQCAWCGRVADQAGDYSAETQAAVAGASHGICPECRTVVRAAFNRPPRAA